MARRRKEREPEPSDVAVLRFADGLLAKAETRFKGRRPNIILSREAENGIRLAVERAGGQLILRLEHVVPMLGLSPAYTDPGRSYLLASSLQRRLKPLGVTVGTRGGGKFLSFALRAK